MSAGRKNFHWRQAVAHSPYLGVGGSKFRKSPTSGRDSHQYYCEPGREEDTRRAFGKLRKWSVFPSLSGCEVSRKVRADCGVGFYYGRMEHTTATTQTDRVLMDARVSGIYRDWLVSHELAHQWFGDLLTCKNGHTRGSMKVSRLILKRFSRNMTSGRMNLNTKWRTSSVCTSTKTTVYRRPIVTNMYRHPTVCSTGTFERVAGAAHAETRFG